MKLIWLVSLIFIPFVFIWFIGFCYGLWQRRNFFLIPLQRNWEEIFQMSLIFIPTLFGFFFLILFAFPAYWFLCLIVSFVLVLAGIYCGWCVSYE